MDMDTRIKQSRSLPSIKPKPNVSGVTLGRIFLSAKVCTSCVQPLGLFLARGSNCPKCGLRVCKKCKVYLDNVSTWTCLVCSKDGLNYGNKSMTIGGKSLKYRDSYSSIKRSWSISATNRGSPVLKAYTKYNNDDRGYSSLPRMPTTTQNQTIRSPNHGGGHFHTHSSNRAKTESPALFDALDFPFESTLHPYLPNEGQRSPTSSINFIEDEYWDYYDYEVNSNRSSCERSLGESVEYKFQHFPDDPLPLPPKKPIRTKKGRSRSVGSYDMANPKYSHLKTYCVLNVQSEKQNLITPPPVRKQRSHSFGKENVARSIPLEFKSETPLARQVLEGPIRIQNEQHFHSLPRTSRSKERTQEQRDLERHDKYITCNSFNTLPKEWKIFKRRDNNSTTIVISGVNSPPNPSASAMSISMHPRPKQFHSRTYISDPRNPPTSSGLIRNSSPRKFPSREPYPSFPNKIQAFNGHRRELKPLLPLYRGKDNRHGLFDLSLSSSTAPDPNGGDWVIPEPLSPTLSGDNGNGMGKSASTSSIFGAERDNGSTSTVGREVIIEIQREGELNNVKKVSGSEPIIRRPVPENDSLGIIDAIKTTNNGMETMGKENGKGALQMETQLSWICDPITSSSDSETDSSSFQSLVCEASGDNNGMGSVGVKVIRGEDKDEFRSCNNDSSEEESVNVVVKTKEQEEPNSTEEPLYLSLSPPEIPIEQQVVGLSDQRANSALTIKRRALSSSSDDDDDRMVLTEINQSVNGQGMNSLNQSKQKYKSRVLIGLESDSTLQGTGSEVEIVLGKGTFLKDPSTEKGKDEESEALVSTKLNFEKDNLPNLEIEHDVHDPEKSGKKTELSQFGNISFSNSYRRQSPEGEESGSDETKHLSETVESKMENSGISPLPAPSRSSPDGADAEKSEGSSPTPVLEMNSEDEAKSESTDSWTEEVSFVEMEPNGPAPLDMTLHTICEESETESEHNKLTPKNSVGLAQSQTQGLEQYFNFTNSTDGDGFQNLQFDFQNYEESEFGDTFSESSFSSELRNSNDFSQAEFEEGEPMEFSSGRLEKYFFNLGVTLSNDSDSVGSESESGTSVLDNKKKVLKHHRRSAEFEEEHYEISEDEDCAFEQDGFDTIKKQRKFRKSQEDLLSSPPTTMQRTSSTETLEDSKSTDAVAMAEDISDLPSWVPRDEGAMSVIEPRDSMTSAEAGPSSSKGTTVSRSNSFNWSSDEEVNLMMRSLRQLIKNMTLSKKPEEGKGEKLLYLENELIRLMKMENMKNIVETMSSDSEDQQEDVYKLFEKADNQPELISKVMTHIGERLSTWMRDEEETEDTATIKCAQSVSSDLNDDLDSDTRFSWKGSFESTLAKRQSVGSSDSLDYYTHPPSEVSELFSDRSILRSSSLHHLANSQPILEESESLTSSLPRLHQPVDSSNSGGSGSGSITKSKSLYLDSHQQEVKSARYRPPGYFEAKNDTHASTPALSGHRKVSNRERYDGLNSTGSVRNEAKVFAIRGQIQFSMEYNYKNGMFEVCIKQCQDLAAVDPKKGRSDPYVKGYLLPDKAKSNKRKTKTKKNTLNPVFGETLKFQVSLEELETRTLWLSVWHSDIFGKNEFLGQVTLPLRGLTFDDTSFSWYPLREEKVLSSEESGSTESPPLDLILALKWTPKGFSRDRGNLSVLVKEAKGLKLIKNSLPSTFIKCAPLSDKTKKQKTPMARRTTTPVWNSTMAFEGVGSDGLEVALYNSDLLNHEQMGNVKLDCDSELWRNMRKREGFWVEGLVQLTTN